MTTIVVMGVVGCGKSTFGRALAQELGCPGLRAMIFIARQAKLMEALKDNASAAHGDSVAELNY